MMILLEREQVITRGDGHTRSTAISNYGAKGIENVTDKETSNETSRSGGKTEQEEEDRDGGGGKRGSMTVVVISRPQDGAGVTGY